MKILWMFWIVFALCAPAGVRAAEDKLIYATNGSGVFGYKHTPVLPWCGFHVHDPDRPAPVRVMNLSTHPVPPRPADAIVLFDGTNTTAWRSNSWKLVDGVWETAGASAPRTKEKFGSFQLHVEWQMPAGFKGPWHDQGNSGVLIHGLYEIQIFDSFNQKWAPDGSCAAIYGQTPPFVNATLPPGEWQSYDMTFTAPVIIDGKVTKPARLTMHHNGVLVHSNQQIYGGTGHKVLPRPVTVSEGPISFAGHGCPVRFRNIWVRKL
jgi:hypothetical protein